MKQARHKGTIVFVHGAWHGKWCWDKYWTPTFKEHGYDVVTFNLPGHDQAGRVKGINKYSFRDYVTSLEKTISALPSPPIIIGHSMGGLIVQKYLQTHPCQKAVLLASIPPYGAIRTTLHFLKKSYAYPALLGLDLYRLVNTSEKASESFFSKDLPQEELKEYSKQLCSESYRAFLNMLLPRIKVNYHTKIPMLVVAAENDTIFSIQHNQHTAKKYNADMIIMKDIAHDAMLDVHQAQVSKAILEWLG